MLLCFCLGIWLGRTKTVVSSQQNKSVLYYVDPMNPAHTSPEPGLAPCGMKMEPVFAASTDQPAGSDLPPGTARISPAKQQLLGVTLAKVEPSPYTYILRATGKIAVDDARTYRLNAYAEGWIVKTYDNSIGSLVRTDEPLAKYYNRDVAAALQTLYYALDAVEQTKQGRQVAGGTQDQLVAQQLAAESLLMNLGMSKKELRHLARTRQFTQEIGINAPITSFVLNRNVSEGQHFDKGEEFYRLADLSKVWILADVYGNETKYIKPGEVVQVTMPSQEEIYEAKVSEVLPQFDTTALTLKVRLILDNPNFEFKPGMFVDVNFPIHLPASLNISIDALMDAGSSKTVFVDHGDGYFEPRQVKTGWRLGDRVEIVDGLKPGEVIVTSGNFLIDSESRMKLAAAGFFGEVSRDPVCGINVDASKAKAAGLKSEYQEKSYYFCSDECQKQFNKKPERYVSKPEERSTSERVESPSEIQIVQQETKDLVCGHELDETQAKAAGLTSTYEGKTYYFCSYTCNKQFDKDPERYLHQEAQGGSGAYQTPVVAKLATDPVCRLPVATGSAKQAGRTSEYQGKIYYFDTDGCKQRFDQDPQAYLENSSEDLLVPPNPYDYYIPQLQGTNLGLKPYRRRNTPPNTTYPSQLPGTPELPKQAPIPPPKDAKESGGNIAPQSQHVPSAPSSPVMADCAGEPAVESHINDTATKEDLVQGLPPRLSSTSSPASPACPAPAPAHPAHDGQKQ